MRNILRGTGRRSLIATASVTAVALAAFIAIDEGSGLANVGLQQDQAGGLVAFRSDDELRRFLRERAERTRRRGEAMSDMAVPAPALSSMDAAPQAAQESAGLVAEPGITNTQEAGVDEGGIVKTYRDMLVILRRGRIFTVSLADGAMRPIDAINAFPPGVNAGSDWYDEMLVSGDRVI